MTNRTPTHTPRRLRVALRCGAVCLLAGGLIYCTDQSDVTSVDPARVPAASESKVLDDDAPQASRVLGAGIEAIAAEHALPAELTETLRTVGESALSGESVRLRGDDGRVRGLRGGTPDLFLAVTPQDGTGDFKTVVLDLAGLRSGLSDNPLAPEALHAELARHLRVVQNSSNVSLLQGMHFECAVDEGAGPSAETLVSGRMTCETTKNSPDNFRVNKLRLKG